MKKMTIAVFLVVAASVLLVAGVSTASGATTQQGSCGTILLQASPNTGADGAAVTATAGNLEVNSPSNLYWDAVGASGLLGFTTTDAGGNFRYNFDVPATASPGTHQIILKSYLPPETAVQCSVDFTVEAAATQTTPTTTSPATANTGATTTTPATATTAATPSKPTSLPDTGFFLAVPAAGIALGGAGGYMIRRRRRQ